MRDVVVAGGGPIGLATALYAARVGLDVVVREPRTGPIDKACGEGLMPAAVADLDRLGVCPEGRPIAGIRYVDEKHEAHARFRAGPGRGVRRTTLHAALSAAVAEAGVVVEPVAVGSVEEHHGLDLLRGHEALASSLTAAENTHGTPAAARTIRRRSTAGRVATSSPWVIRSCRHPIRRQACS